MSKVFDIQQVKVGTLSRYWLNVFECHNIMYTTAHGSKLFEEIAKFMFPRMVGLLGIRNAKMILLLDNLFLMIVLQYFKFL